MCASVVTGQYGRVQQLLSLSSLQEWLTFRLAQIVHAFGDAMQVVEPPVPGVARCAERHAVALFCAVCPILAPRHSWSISLLRPPW
jgi:hypothetical protein